MKEAKPHFQYLSQGYTRARQSKRKLKIKKILLTLFIFIIVIFIGIFAIMPPYISEDMVNIHVDFNKYYSSEDYGITSKELTLKTSDGIRIAAHEVYVEKPKAVVIFISGIHNPSVTAFFDHSRLLKENGYASILYEMRAHGESEGDLVSLGLKEYLDTQAVVDYITSNPDYKDVPIVVFGVSMGGTTAINSIGQTEEIDGLISISAFSSFEDVFVDNMELMGVPKLICTIEKPFVKLYLGFKYGFDVYNINPKNEIKKLGNRPALIMHTKGDSEVPFNSFERIVASAPDHIETWTRDEDLHFFVKDDALDNLKLDSEYSNKIISFLNKNFAK